MFKKQENVLKNYLVSKQKRISERIDKHKKQYKDENRVQKTWDQLMLKNLRNQKKRLVPKKQKM